MGRRARAGGTRGVQDRRYDCRARSRRSWPGAGAVVMQRESKSDRTQRASRVAALLAQLYPQARVSLDFTTPWECLVATILSAQCTDARVNQVTPRLFAEVPDIRA